MTTSATSRQAEGRPDACFAREMLDRIGDKWSVLVIANLGAGPLRFKELQRRSLGISQRMLTQTLRLLERDGLLWREVTPTVPLTVTYGLTALGETLLGPVIALLAWSEGNRDAIEAARAAFDQRR